MTLPPLTASSECITSSPLPGPAAAAAAALGSSTLSLYRVWTGFELQPGQSLDWPLWVHPKGAGQMRFNCVWYFEPTVSRVALLSGFSISDPCYTLLPISPCQHLPGIWQAISLCIIAILSTTGSIFQQSRFLHAPAVKIDATSEYLHSITGANTNRSSFW